MKGRQGGKRRAAWLRFSCFSGPVDEASNSEERWKAGSKAINSKLGAKRAIFKGKQGPSDLFRDSQSRLEAYLGQGQQGLHATSESVLSQAAHTAATERRLKGLLDDQLPCNSNAAPSTSPLDSVLVGPSSFTGAAPLTPSKLLNRVSGLITPPDDSEASKTSQLQDATPTASDSDRSQESILQLAGDFPSLAPLAAPFDIPTQHSVTPFDSNTVRFSSYPALDPCQSSQSLASAAESMLTEGSIKLEALAPAPSHHKTIRTISIKLDSTILDALALSNDGDAVSQQNIQPQQQLGRHQRAKTMPHCSTSQDSFLLEDKASVYGSASVNNCSLKRIHTAVVLLSSTDDENEEEEVKKVEEAAAAAPSSSSDALVTSSSMMSNRGSRTMRRRLSEVYEGHHIPLQKLRKQMGNPEDPPGDLLSLMARRVFSQQGIVSRVNSDGLISVLNAHSSFNTPSNQEQQEVPNSDWLEAIITSLPRIRTQVVNKRSSDTAVV